MCRYTRVNTKLDHASSGCFSASGSRFAVVTADTKQLAVYSITVSKGRVECISQLDAPRFAGQVVLVSGFLTDFGLGGCFFSKSVAKAAVTFQWKL